MRLILVRHASARRAVQGQPDHQRPLAEEGAEEARATARALSAKGWKPDLVLSSDALRTRQTWAAMADVLGDPPVTFTRALYGADPAGVLQTWLDFTLETSRVQGMTGLLLGHNPTWEMLAEVLSGVPASLPPAGAVLLAHPGSAWDRSVDGAGWEHHGQLDPG